MAEFLINVIINPSAASAGAKVVRQELGSIDSSAGRTEKLLKRAFTIAAIAAGIKTLASFDQAMATVGAVSGATGAQLKQLSDTARQLGITTRFSATEAAEALLELARAGFTVNESMEAVDDTLILAQAGALSLNKAAEITGTTLRGFRLNADQASRAVDVLAKAANTSNADVTELGDALGYVAPIAAGVSVTLEQTVAAIAALSDAGIKGSAAGTGLRRVISELESPTAAAIDLLREMGITTAEVRVSQVGLTGALERLAAAGITTGDALELFGDRGGPAFEVLSKSLPKLHATTEALENAGGTAAEVAKIMDANLSGALRSVRSALEGVLLGFGELGATNVLTDVFRGLAGVLRTVAQNIDGLSKVLTVATAAGAAFFLVMKAAPIISAAQAFVQLFTAVASGRAVLLGSAQAEAQRAAAAYAAATANQAQIASQLAATRAELAGAEATVLATTATQAQTGAILVNTRGQALLMAALDGSAAAQGRLAVATETANLAFAHRQALLKQVTALEGQQAVASAASAAAQARLGTAAKSSSGALGLLLAPLRGIAAFALANPITAVVTAVVAVGAALYAFRDDIAFTSDGLVTLRTLTLATFEAFRGGAQTALAAASAALESLANSFGGLPRVVGAALLSVVTTVAGQLGLIPAIAKSVINDFIGKFVAAGKVIVFVFAEAHAAIEDIFSDVPPSVDTFGERLSAVLRESLDHDYVGDIGGSITAGLKGIVDRAREIGREAAAAAGEAAGESAVAGPQLEEFTLPRRDPAFAEVIRDLTRERDIVGLSNREHERRAAIFAIEDQLQRRLLPIERYKVDLLQQEIAARSDSKAINEYLKHLNQEASLLGLTGSAREARIAQLQIEDQLGRQLTQTELGQISALQKEVAARAALEKYRDEISSSVGAAKQLAEAHSHLAEAVRIGAASAQEAAQIEQIMTAQLAAQLDPLGYLNDELDTHAYLLGLNAHAREVEAQVIAATQQLLAQGKPLSDAELLALREKFIALQDLNAITQEQDRLLAGSVDARQQFVDQVTAIKALLADTSSGFTEGDAAAAIAQTMPDMFKDTDVEQKAQQAHLDILKQQADYYRDNELISEEAWGSARMKIRAKEFALQTKNASGFFSGLADLMQSGHAKLFKIGKAAAVANALISGTESVMNALAVKPWYVGAALAIGAAATAAANISNIRNAQPPGFMVGGYTGNLATDQIAGVVHGNEYVMDAAATRRIGVDNLDAMRSGGPPSPAAQRGDGGSSGGARPLYVTIENYGTSKDYDVQQISADEVRVIARDEAKREVIQNAPKVIAGQLGDPNSDTSKAMSRNYAARRQR